MNNKIKVLSLSLAAMFFLSSCSAIPGEISETSGVGRSPAATEDTTLPPIDEPKDESAWSVEDGKYTYNLPARDDSRRDGVYSLTSNQYGEFDDQPDDWYAGKTTYDEATGEVTYVWDRSASTLGTMKKYGAIYRGDETKNVCYLTFDCGYEYGSTAKILDTLRDRKVPGTFFLTGHFVKTEHDLIARMLDEGHVVANHTVNHKNMTALTVDEFMKELDGLEELYYKEFPDAPQMLFFRPPQGTSNEWLMELAYKLGYTTVMWSWTYYDFDVDNQPDVAESLAKAKAGLHPGAVYLLHAESSTNAEMLGDLIDWIRAQGYEILPLCDITYPRTPAAAETSAE